MSLPPIPSSNNENRPYGQQPQQPGQPQYGPPQPQYGQQQPPQYGPPQPQYGPPQGHPQGFQQPLPPVAKSGWSKAAKITVAGVVGGLVVVGGGAAFAVTLLLQPSGDHPYDVLPSNAFGYVELDSDPSADQKAAYISIQNKISDMVDSEESDGNIKEEITGALDLDYSSDVEPWLGDRVGVGIYEDSKSEAGYTAYAAYQIKDKTALKSVQDDIALENVVIDDYLIVALDETSAGIPADGFDGTLSEDKVFMDDLKSLGDDNVAVAWIDAGAAQKAEGENSDLTSSLEGLTGAYGLTQSDDSGEDPKIEGRVVAGLHLENSAVELRAKTLGIKVDGESPTLDFGSANVAEDIQALPADSVAALSVGDLDKVLTSLWEEYPEIANEFEDSSSVLADYGIVLPDDITKLIGSTTSGALLAGGDEGVSGVLTLNGADGDLLQGLEDAAQDEAAAEAARYAEEEAIYAEEAAARTAEAEAEAEAEARADAELYGYEYQAEEDPYAYEDEQAVEPYEAEDLVTIEEKDGKVVVGYGDVDLSDTLADNKKFKAALPDLKDSEAAVYVDIDSVYELITGFYGSYGTDEEGAEAEPTAYGVLGLTAQWDKDESTTVLRWVLP